MPPHLRTPLHATDTHSIKKNSNHFSPFFRTKYAVLVLIPPETSEHKAVSVWLPIGWTTQIYKWHFPHFLFLKYSGNSYLLFFFFPVSIVADLELVHWGRSMSKGFDRFSSLRLSSGWSTLWSEKRVCLNNVITRAWGRIKRCHCNSVLSLSLSS